MLYREATNKEVYDFLHNDFITLENDFSAENVKTAILTIKDKTESMKEYIS